MCEALGVSSLRKSACGRARLIYTHTHTHTHTHTQYNTHYTTHTEQDNLIPWHLQKTFKQEATGHGQLVHEKNSVVYKRFYHMFVEGESEQLLELAGGFVYIKSLSKRSFCRIIRILNSVSMSVPVSVSVRARVCVCNVIDGN